MKTKAGHARERHMKALGAQEAPKAFLCLLVQVILLLVLTQQPVPGLAWGDRGHKLINAAVVDNLPEPPRGCPAGLKFR